MKDKREGERGSERYKRMSRIVEQGDLEHSESSIR
jgi:hypothetical protein